MQTAQRFFGTIRLGAAWASLVLALAGLFTPLAHAGKLPYSYFYTGNPNITPVIAPSNRASTPSFVVMGGGPDVDVAFQWMITRAGVVPGSGGRFVVIRATGTDAYNAYIYENDASVTPWPTVVGGAGMGLSSVETLVIPSTTAANHPFVNQIVARADAVFIAGGDQSDYLKYWKGTALNNTLNSLIERRVPIGGTSAGLAVLGQFDYAALRGGVTTAQALANPFNKYMTLDPSPQTLTTSSTSNPGGGFITPHLLFNSIVDAHLDARDRMGRLVAFVARLIAPNGTTGCAGGILSSSPTLPSAQNKSYGGYVARGIGVDVETALLLEGDGYTSDVIATRVTNPDTSTTSAAYFLWPQSDPTQCTTGQPLSVSNVRVTRVDQGNPTFNLSTWSGGSATYTLTVTNGVLSSSTGSVY